MLALSILTFILAACAAEQINLHRNRTHASAKENPPFRPEARSCSLISVERRVDCLPAVNNGNQSALFAVQLQSKHRQSLRDQLNEENVFRFKEWSMLWKKAILCANLLYSYILKKTIYTVLQYSYQQSNLLNLPCVADECERRGCCWASYSGLLSNVPWCFYPTSYPTYTFTNTVPTPTGVRFDAVRSWPSHYPNNVMRLKGEITEYAGGITRVKVCQVKVIITSLSLIRCTQNLDWVVRVVLGSGKEALRDPHPTQLPLSCAHLQEGLDYRVFKQFQLAPNH